MKKAYYYVFSSGEWLKCKKALVLESGWLEYKLPDGTEGLTPAHKWRYGILGSHNTVWPRIVVNERH